MANKKSVMMGDDVVANVGYSNAGLAKPSEPEYPYCLRIHLGPQEIANLGMTELPKLGSEMMLLAKVKVMGMRVDSEMGNTLEIQITDMAMSEEKSREEKKPKEQVLYGETKKEV